MKNKANRARKWSPLLRRDVPILHRCDLLISFSAAKHGQQRFGQEARAEAAVPILQVQTANPRMILSLVKSFNERAELTSFLFTNMLKTCQKPHYSRRQGAHRRSTWDAILLPRAQPDEGAHNAKRALLIFVLLKVDNHSCTTKR